MDNAITLNDDPDTVAAKMRRSYAEAAEASERRRAQQQEIGNLKRGAEQATAEFERKTKGLYDSDGFKRYPDHEERLSFYRRERNQVLNEVEAQARETFARYQGQADEIDSSPTIELLSDSEQKEVSEKMPLFTTEARAGSASLIRRLERAVSAEDRVTAAGLITAARVEILEKRRRDGETRLKRNPGKSALEDAVDTAESRLFGKERAERRESVDGKLDDLRGILQLTYLGKRDARSFHQLHAQQYAINDFVKQQREAGGFRGVGGGPIARDRVRPDPDAEPIEAQAT